MGLASTLPPRDEREKMQRAAGVSSFGDMSMLLNTAPREVVELLRITAVVRSVTGPLGAGRAERLRVNGSYALRGWVGPGGLAAAEAGGVAGAGEGAGEEGEGRGLGYRLKIQSRLAVIGGYIWTNTLMMRVLLATLHVFGQNVPMA